MSIDRKRLSPDESRDRALEAARQILIDEGPQAVTLKAVASRVGRTHANVLHHFGSAAGLQRALAGTMAEQVCATIAEVVQQARRGEADPHDIVDMTFDAFDRQGAGALAMWMLLSGNEDALDPILAAILRLVDQLAGDDHDAAHIREETLNLVLMALGDALLGKPMADALGLPRETARELAYKQLTVSPAVQAKLDAS
jgi:AcrR family transcriptional regulator